MDFLTSQIVANICEIIIAFFTAFMALGIWYARNSLEEIKSNIMCKIPLVMAVTL